MGVSRDLICNYSYEFLAAWIAYNARCKSGAVPLAYRYSALQVGKREITSAIAAILCPQEREQGRVLRDRHNLPVTKSPAVRREIKTEYLNLCNIWFAHD